MPDLYAQILKHCLSIFFIYSSLRKNSNALHSLLKRVVSTFSKDTGELASSFLEFMRQILNSDTMVSVYIYVFGISHIYKLNVYVKKNHLGSKISWNDVIWNLELTYYFFHMSSPH